jgi:hypothetical protein
VVVLSVCDGRGCRGGVGESLIYWVYVRVLLKKIRAERRRRREVRGG